MHSKENIETKPLKKQMVADLINENWRNGKTLAGKVTAWHDIKNKFDWISAKMPRMMQELQEEQRIACIGTALDAGRKDLRPTYKVYAPYGTPALVHVALPRESKPIKYKGERTGPRYWNAFSTPELSPHDYDLYAGRNLAMLAR